MSCRDRGRGRGRGHGDRGHSPHSPHRGHSPHSPHRGHRSHSPHRGHSPQRGHSCEKKTFHFTEESQMKLTGGTSFTQVTIPPEKKTFHFTEESQIKLTGDTSVTQVTIPPEVSRPVIQPTIPYVGQLPIKLGMRLHVVGLVPHHAKQFQINFKTGVKDSDDVAFHFNPRIGQYVYMNIFLNGKWQKEELGPEKPFAPGTPFKLLFIINRDFYEVHANGVHLYTFKHRMALERVTTLGIVGDVSIIWLGFEDSRQTITSTFTIPSEVSNPVIQPSIPYVGPIAGGIKTGMRLHLEGAVPLKAKQFQINFKTGVKDSDDVAFHFNPRIGETVYMNIFRNGKWEKAELGPDKPFVPGALFKLLFLIKKDSYEVHVNGVNLYTFNHRIPLDRVTTLGILGDVSILWLGFETWTSPRKLILMGCGSWTFIPLEISYPITNPAIPYGGEIPGRIKQDMAIVFQGTVHADATRFAINFMTGPSGKDDIAFHYNPRIGNCTAMNSRRNGSWETQENACHKPFTRGGAFIILVVINSEGYEVYVNGIKHCTFKHRIPQEKVSNIAIDGHISLLTWGLIDSWSATASCTELKKIKSTPTTTSTFEISNPISKPALPYVGTIQGGLKPDTAIFLQGTVPADGKSFEINLKTGPTEADDIAFHYNPRFGDCTALNSKRNGSWEKQENECDKPFTKGGAFQMFIAVKPDAYDVYVNGSKHCTFKHRFPLDKVSTLNFKGDVSLFIYGLIQKWTIPFVSIKEKRTLLMGSGSTSFIPLEVRDPISKPAVPYTGEIPGSVKPDMAIVFQGTVPVDATSFEINFMTGPSENDDTAFHYKPCIGEFTALNSKRNGSWQTQENACHNPFTRGGAFIIVVVINSEGYQVYVNGIKHCTFAHRLPLEKVTNINIRGNVSLLVWGLIDSWSTTPSSTELKKITSTWTSTTRSTTSPFEISYPITKPALPYVGTIQGGLKPDTAIFLQGTVPADGKSFEINLKTGPTEADDIAFHYNPRFGDCTALNSKRNGSWEKQENECDKPFTKGGAFQMFIAVKPDAYDVYVNGSKHCTFKHRFPLDKVSTLNFKGDVSLFIYGLIQKWTIPFVSIKEKRTLLMGSGSTSFIPLEVRDPISKPAVPYTGEIPGSVKPDMAIVFQGTVPLDATSFEINFMTGPSENDDTAFHYKPCIGEFTALNSKRNGSWETQENACHNPFTRGGAFIIVVVINSEGYQVYVNGIKHCTFPHRLPLEKVSNINIRGNVSLLVWGLIDSWSTTPSSTELKKITSTWTSTTRSTTSPFEISYPITKPALPYVGTIQGGLKPDTAIFLQGTVPADGKSFEINLKTGPTEADDIAFHYNPRFGDCTALNSKRNGSWEKQENECDKPFTKGGAFQMFIAVKPDAYDVYVNGSKHCTFKHRFPLDKVSTLNFKGDVSLFIYGLIQKWTIPFVSIKEKRTLLMGSGSTSFIPLEVRDPISKPAVPYTGEIPGSVKPDMAIVFQGTVPLDATSFEINFMTGPSENDDTAFHYKPCIGEFTALNSKRNGSWETQENACHNPFTRGGAFIIVVVINSEGYQVYVNGIKHCTFPHRLPLEKVSNINIRGNVSLLVWGLIDSWSTTPSSTELKKITSTWTSTTRSTTSPFEISYPITKPALPYVGTIQGGLKPDTAIFLQGTVPADGKSFEINLKTGPTEADDIAFHYNPRFGDCTALNSKRNGSWEKQENECDKPFTKGGAFQMFIAVKPDAYDVYVNGSKHCTFKHRFPLDKVSTLNFKGDVSLFIYGLIQKWTIPFVSIKEKRTLLMGSGSTSFIPLEVRDPISKPAVPYTGEIPGSVKPDMAIVFQGTVPLDATSFEINFMTGPSENDDTAFHYKPCIGEFTALNSKRNGSWETQENACHNPFTRGGAFIIVVVINSEGYQVYVNGIKHCTFPHRLPLEKVSNINIRGNVSLLVWGLIDSWSTTPSSTELKKITSTWTSTSRSTTSPFEISYPITKPALPYVGTIQGGLKPDTAIFLQGTVPADGKSFEINLKTGPTEADDIAFHYNPRFGDCTALNSKRNGSWEKQENECDKPFTKGGAFQMFIAVKPDAYDVYVNGSKHCTFKHRFPLDKVSTLNFKGDVSLFIYGLIQKWTIPFVSIKEKRTLLMGSGSTSFIPLEVRDPISKPVVPYTGEIPGSVKPDMAIVFQGTVPLDATSFEINFMTGPSENDDTAFHYKPCIGEFTALNSKRNGSWETQENACHNPFTRGGAFIIVVVINSESYQVYVNGIKHCTFPHRLPLEKVSNINIRGNVSLLVWGLIDSWSTTPSSTELKKITSTWTSTTRSTTSPFEISYPITKPALPYVGTIQGGLKPDTAIFLQGAVPADGKSFEINLKTGPTEADDIAFHYNPRFGDCTALNSKRNGSWEKQENECDKPFTKGGAFQMFIAVKPDAYDVYVNGSKHCTFKHRFPLDKVSTLNFKGDVSLFIYGLIQKWTIPFVSIKEKRTLLMGSGSTSFIPLEVRDPISKPVVPYTGEIPGSVKPDMAIVFQGTVPVDATSFEINFMTGPSETDDTAFHYKPCIGEFTALNSKRNGSWETQENACHNPFTRGGAFIIVVVINSESYQVYVNGIKHCTFAHRLPLEKVSNINIRGNVSLLVWGLIDSWSTTPSSTELKKITSTWTSTSRSTTSPFEISYPITKPALPYVGTIQGGLKPDTAIFLQGTVPADGKSFEINLKTGPTEADDIAFHYNPRFGDCTALNSKRNGSWEKQENECDKPFTKGGAFQMFIAVKPDAYDVYVNGSKHCTFKHRFPLDKVSTLNFKGDVSLFIYGLIQKWTIPFVSIKEKRTLLMGSGSTSFIPLEVRDPISKPVVPYTGEIPGSVKPDMAIVFQGTVPLDATSFEINFMTGPSENDDTAFHYKPCIGEFTALNSKRNGSWETQENACHNPFTRGGAFIIVVVINSESYQVYVNGIKHCTFPHRLPLEKVSNINIRGNVSLLVWGLIDSWSTTPSSTELKKITSTWTSTTRSTTSPFEISYPITKPALPYVGTIQGGLKPDTAIFLQGAVPADGKSFEINLKTGPTEADDIAFHYNPRFGDCTALNSKRNGSWEKQENECDKPFTKGGAFQMFIAVKPDAYDVYVNGSKHCTFKHRFPLDKVSTLNFKGDVSLFIYGLIQKWTIPFVSIKEKRTLLMGSGSTSFIPLEVRDPISKPVVPYTGEIPGSVKPDMAIVFQGTVPVDATSFEINFKTGPSENDDTAFHYNPRIGECTALNSKRNGSWETQENACHNPFTRGGAFIIVVVINSEGYQVYVNGIKHCTFPHRLPLEKVSNINIRGNVSLLVWGLIDSWSTTPSSTELMKITSTWTSTSKSTTSPFEISNPISKPTLPYVGTIEGGLKPDTAIFLQGTVPADGKSFEINFKTGPSEGDDIAFHYNPRFGDCTALNSKRNGSWETRENASDKPFTKGGAFQIFIALKSDTYEVYVNGSKHCTFKYRIPLEKVSTLNFKGDVSLLIYGLIPKWTFPSVFIKEKKSLTMESGSTTPIPLEISDPISNPTLPYVGQIPEGIKSDMAVVFQGTVPVDATGFEINFKSGPSDSDDTAFHYNPRIGDCTALNSKRNGSWETQENACHKPFTRGGAFIIIVVINREGYEVFVNGLKHCTFKHRTPLEKVSTINIQGNVSLLVFGFINSWSMTSSFMELQKITSTQISTSSPTSLPLEISNPIINPALPATCKIPGGVQHDSAVFFQGTVPADAKGFIINFKTGPSEGDDIAFQYNPRFGEFTALNSFRKGSWETQEKAPDKPFTKGAPFQIIISINSNSYEVYVNGLKHCIFNHRIPLEKVSTLDIRGDISQLICGFIQGWSTSTFFSQLQQTTVIESSTIMTESGPVEISHPVINPTLPHLDKIPGGLKQDMALFIQGSIPPDGKGFIINFKTGPTAGDDIAFHYNLKIGEGTALNSFKSGKWEMQENTSDEPFARGGVFQIIFVINSEGYEVYVNGLRHCLFKHRTSLEKVSTLDISGDALISICGYIYNWSASAIFSEINKIQSSQSSTSTTMTLEISQPITNPVVPYVGKIPIVVKKDKAVFFQGNVLENANEFQINFKTGPSDGDDIAFHFSPHIGKYTALNCFRNGTWEKEEHASDQPFTKGSPFQIIVAFKSEGYEVYSNGMKHCTFKHHIGLEKVSTIEVHGEVALQLIGFVENWSSP